MKKSCQDKYCKYLGEFMRCHAIPSSETVYCCSPEEYEVCEVYHKAEQDRITQSQEPITNLELLLDEPS